MGDRGNIAVTRYGGDPVYLYTHWTGYKLADDLRTALLMEERWDDPAYLARIIFDVMTDGHHGETSGFGISSIIEDGGDNTWIVDTYSQEITHNGKTWDFNEFVNMGVGHGLEQTRSSQ